MVPIKIEMQTLNRLEEDVREPCVVKDGAARIYIGDFLVYRLAFANMVDGLRMTEEAVRKLQAFQVVRSWTKAEVQEKIIGRPVFYWTQPAIITWFIGGLVFLKADGDHNLLTPYESPPEATLAEDLLSPLIYWWREE